MFIKEKRFCCGAQVIEACSCPDNEDNTSSKCPKGEHEGHVDKMAAVEEIEEKLREKHKGIYTEEQIRCWAHLI